MTPDPEQIVADIRAARSDEEAIAIERQYVADTAEEDPGEVVTHEHDRGHGQGGEPGRG